ncbi:MAG: hypothetical protein CEN88_7 [Candidatus Berkelbacteria bacterium Licking1014_2]|uniref:ASCH domain-containing protein n=1 Tax=Candidatus Berkelbacteria bacterium Licking1014_2 TaxID=2017146 RepID=A0A554LXB8_9BACT|nr:MAG: hypothetical protein CEN88_7 [Candidatus Berkelbacteria bacterium Licking1014_2]
MKHLAIFVGRAIEEILAGNKTVEGRLTNAKIPPYMKVAKDDEILLKQSGGKIIGRVMADNVLYYDNLTPEAVGSLRKEYGEEMMVGDEFWQKKAKARLATIIFLKKPQRFLAPLKDKKKDRRPWVILS